MHRQRRDDCGKLLGVAYVLEGSVRKADGQVRITAQLVRADDGFHVWSESYDRKLENVFALQADIAGAIAQALQLPLGMGGSDGLVSQRTTVPQAYALYLQGRSAYKARGDGVKKSIAVYRQALQLDPKFAPAWAGLCDSLAVLPFWVSAAGLKETPTFLGEAEVACKHALQLAPDMAEAHTALASLYTFKWEWARAEPHFRRALELAPNDPEVHFAFYKWLGSMGRREEALQASERAIALDPLVPIFLDGHAYSLALLGRVDEQIAQAQAAFALTPDLVYIASNLLSGYLHGGRLDEAEKLLDQIRPAAKAAAAREGRTDDPQRIDRASLRLARHPGQREAIRKELSAEEFQRVLANLGDPDASLALLESEIDAHVTGVNPVQSLRGVQLDAYKKDRRYVRMLRKAGFDADGKLP